MTGNAHVTGSTGTVRGTESVIATGTEKGRGKAPTVKTGKRVECLGGTETVPLAPREIGTVSGCDCKETGIENTGIDIVRCSFIFFHHQFQ